MSILKKQLWKIIATDNETQIEFIIEATDYTYNQVEEIIKEAYSDLKIISINTIPSATFEELYGKSDMLDD